MALGWQEKIWMKFFPTSFNVWNLQNWYAFQGLIMFVWGENLTYFKLESLFFVRDQCGFRGLLLATNLRPHESLTN